MCKDSAPVFRSGLLYSPVSVSHRFECLFPIFSLHVCELLEVSASPPLWTNMPAASEKKSCCLWLFMLRQNKNIRKKKVSCVPFRLLCIWCEHAKFLLVKDARITTTIQLTYYIHIYTYIFLHDHVHCAAFCYVKMYNQNLCYGREVRCKYRSFVIEILWKSSYQLHLVHSLSQLHSVFYI